MSNDNPAGAGRVTAEAARTALDNLDDFARMANVDPIGPRGVLGRFIDQAERAAGPRPLTYEQIDALRLATGYAAGQERLTAIVRATERAHGITPQEGANG